MSNVAPCGACQMGEHEHHIEHWRKMPEGVLGGTVCLCPGDCQPPQWPWLDAFRLGAERVADGDAS